MKFLLREDVFPTEGKLNDNCLSYCKVRNINGKVILATLTSGSDSLILRSVNICSILYLNYVSSHIYTWSVDNHTCIQSVSSGVSGRLVVVDVHK